MFYGISKIPIEYENVRMQDSWLKTFIAGSILSAFYYGSARLGLGLQFEQTQASPVWPPTGIAIAALFVLGTRYWWAIFLGALLANLGDFYIKSEATENFIMYTVNHPKELWVSSGIGIGNTLEAFLAVFALKQLGLR